MANKKTVVWMIAILVIAGQPVVHADDDSLHNNGTVVTTLNFEGGAMTTKRYDETQPKARAAEPALPRDPMTEGDDPLSQDNKKSKNDGSVAYGEDPSTSGPLIELLGK